MKWSDLQSVSAGDQNQVSVEKQPQNLLKKVKVTDFLKKKNP